MAGIVAAKDNSIGVVGIAPDARLWSIKVLDNNGAGSISDVIAGIDYVTAHSDEIDVVNLSFGCECSSPALYVAINNAVPSGYRFRCRQQVTIIRMQVHSLLHGILM